MLTSVGFFVLAFVCPLAGAGIGMVLRRRLPAHHLSSGSIDVIKLTTGLMATLVALVLSLLVSSGNTFRNGVENEYKQALAGIVQLDECLRAYGPETRDIRSVIRVVVGRSFQQHWQHEDFGPGKAADATRLASMVDVQRQILSLEPRDAAQKWFQSQAVQLSHDVVRVAQLLSSDQSATNPPRPVLIFVLLCSAVIFAIFSLFVEPNATVIAAFVASALTIAAGIFLIIELNSPFGGILEVPSAPARAVYNGLGK
jgi:hypothetical protein